MQTEITSEWSDQMSSDECKAVWTERVLREFYLAVERRRRGVKGGTAIHLEDVSRCLRRLKHWRTLLQVMRLDPEDFTQEFMVDALEYGLTFYNPIFTYTQYASYMLLRTATRLRPQYRNEHRRRPFSIIEGKAAKDLAVPDAAHQNQTRAAIEDVIDQFDKPVSEAIRERWINKRKVREVAQMLGISENAVWSCLRRAKALILARWRMPRQYRPRRRPPRRSR